MRLFQVFASPSIDTPVPAIVVLSGAYASLGKEEARDGLIPYAGAGKAIVVYPEDVHESWNAGACCGPAWAQDVDDADFIRLLVTTVQRRADVASVSLVGYSNGGKLAYEVVCTHPDLVDAFAVVAASPTAPCPAGPPVPLLVLGGTNDPIQAYSATSKQHVKHGFPEAPLVAEVAKWVRRDVCARRAEALVVGALSLKTWGSCAGGTAVQLASYLGEGHRWPPGGGGTPSAAATIWSFIADTASGP